MSAKSEVGAPQRGLRANNALTWATRFASTFAAMTAALTIAGYAVYSLTHWSVVGYGDIPAAFIGSLPFVGVAALGHFASQHAAAMATSVEPRAELTAARSLVGGSLIPLFFGFVLSIGLALLGTSELSGLAPLVINLAKASVPLCVLAQLAPIVAAVMARAPAAVA